MRDRITYVSSCGGLCNRLRALGACLTVAEYLGLDRTQLIWFPNHSCHAEFEDLFVSRPNKWQPEISFHYGPSAQWDWHLSEDYYSGLVVNSIGTSNQVFRQLKKYYKFELEDREFHRLYCEVIRKQFVPLIHIREKMWEFKDKYNLSERVGVQIRDSSDHWIMRFGDDDYEAERKERNDNFKKIIKDSDGLFLSTDSKHVAEDLSNTENIVTFPKEWTTDGANWVEEYRMDKYNHVRFTSIEDAVIDLFLLSECKELVTSGGSSFGDMAAALGGIKNVALS